MPLIPSAVRCLAPWSASFLAVLLNCGLSLPALYGAPSVEWVSQIGSAGQDAGNGVEADGQGNVYMAGVRNIDALISRLDSGGAVHWNAVNDSPKPISNYGYNDVAADGHGRVFAVGYYSDQFRYDATVARYSTDGALMWQKTFGTDSSEFAYGACTDGMGNVYVTGFTEGNLVRPVEGPDDLFVSKFDENGNQLWTKQFGTDGTEWGFRLTADRMGNVLVGAQTSGDFSSVNPDDGFTRDALVMKLDADGNTLWRQSSRLGDDYSIGVGADQAGNVYLGRSDGGIVKYDVNGNLLWEREGIFYTRGLTVDALGNAFLTGSAPGPPNGDMPNYDVAIVKYQPDGTRGWLLTAGSPLSDGGESIHADGLGNLYVTGNTDGAFGGPIVGTSPDAFVLKIAGAVPEPGAMTVAAALLVSLGMRREVRLSVGGARRSC